MNGLTVDNEIISYRCYKKIIESYNFKFSEENCINDFPGKTVITSINFIKNKYNIDLDIVEKVDYFRVLEEKYLDDHGPSEVRHRSPSPNKALVLEVIKAGIQAAYDAKIPIICIPDMKYPET